MASLEIFHRNALWSIYVYCYLLDYALDGYTADLLQDLATIVVRHCYSALCLAADPYFGITSPITRCFGKPKKLARSTPDSVSAHAADPDSLRF